MLPAFAKILEVRLPTSTKFEYENDIYYREGSSRDGSARQALANAFKQK